MSVLTENKSWKSREKSIEPGDEKNAIPRTLCTFLKRIEELEQRVSRLENEAAFEDVLHLPKAPKPKRGPKPALRQEEIIRRRDALIVWIEDNWPELNRAIRLAKKAEHLIPALRRLKGKPNWPVPFHSEGRTHWPLLWQFTQSKRFRDNPRNIANAMAGIPEMSWKRSFDICSSNPSQLEIQRRAIRAYLQRKVPERLRAIRKAEGDVYEIRRILRWRTKDRHLFMLADQARQIEGISADGVAR